MVWRNPYDNKFEAELSFPLPEGGAVCGYAVDIEGKLVPGVMVTKEKARATFEAEVRKDRGGPAMIEQSVGNLFNTRINPFLPGGSRTIQVSFTQDLVTAPSNSAGQVQNIYRLPFTTPTDYPCLATILATMPSYFTPSISPNHHFIDSSTDTTSQWIKQKNNQIGKFEFVFSGICRAWTLVSPLVITLSGSTVDSSIIYEHCDTDCMSIAASIKGIPAQASPLSGLVHLLEPSSSSAWSSSKIGILWDSSKSRAPAYADREIEIGALEKLLKLFASQDGSVSFDVIPFNVAPSPSPTTFLASQITPLIEKLRYSDGILFHGGTDYNKLESLVSSAASSFGSLFASYKLWIVITDGISTFGSTQLPNLQAPVYILSAATTGDPALLRRWARLSNGKFFNLRTMDPSFDITKGFSDNSTSFLYATLGNVQLITDPTQLEEDKEVHPLKPSISIVPSNSKTIDASTLRFYARLNFATNSKLKALLESSSSLSSSSGSGLTQLTLYFGIKSDATITHQHTFEFDLAQVMSLGIPKSTPISERAWAQGRLTEVQAAMDDLGKSDESEEKKLLEKEQIAVSKRFTLVTPNTSLIVLETLQQYLDHMICPPIALPDIYRQYNKRIAARVVEEESKRFEKTSRVHSWWQRRTKWADSMDLVHTKQHIGDSPRDESAPEISDYEIAFRTHGISELDFKANRQVLHLFEYGMEEMNEMPITSRDTFNHQWHFAPPDSKRWPSSPLTKISTTSAAKKPSSSSLETSLFALYRNMSNDPSWESMYLAHRAELNNMIHILPAGEASRKAEPKSMKDSIVPFGKRRPGQVLAKTPATNSTSITATTASSMDFNLSVMQETSIEDQPTHPELVYLDGSQMTLSQDIPHLSYSTAGPSWNNLATLGEYGGTIGADENELSLGMFAGDLADKLDRELDDYFVGEDEPMRAEDDEETEYPVPQSHPEIATGTASGQGIGRLTGKIKRIEEEIQLDFEPLEAPDVPMQVQRGLVAEMNKSSHSFKDTKARASRFSKKEEAKEKKAAPRNVDGDTKDAGKKKRKTESKNVSFDKPSLSPIAPAPAFEPDIDLFGEEFTREEQDEVAYPISTESSNFADFTYSPALADVGPTFSLPNSLPLDGLANISLWQAEPSAPPKPAESALQARSKQKPMAPSFSASSSSSSSSSSSLSSSAVPLSTRNTVMAATGGKRMSSSRARSNAVPEEPESTISVEYGKGDKDLRRSSRRRAQETEGERSAARPEPQAAPSKASIVSIEKESSERYSISKRVHDEDLDEIAASMQHLREISQDISRIADDQGALLDNIESNVTHARDEVALGTAQLSVASNYRKNRSGFLSSLASTFAIGRDIGPSHSMSLDSKASDAVPTIGFNSSINQPAQPASSLSPAPMPPPPAAMAPMAPRAQLAQPPLYVGGMSGGAPLHRSASKFYNTPPPSKPLSPTIQLDMYPSQQAASGCCDAGGSSVPNYSSPIGSSSSGERFRSLQSAQDRIEEVKGVMMENIDQVLSRGERLESLVERSENLTLQSQVFLNKSYSLQKTRWWRNLRIAGVIALILSLLTGLLWGSSWLFDTAKTRIIWNTLVTLLPLVVDFFAIIVGELPEKFKDRSSKTVLIGSILVLLPFLFSMTTIALFEAEKESFARDGIYMLYILLHSIIPFELLNKNQFKLVLPIIALISGHYWLILWLGYWTGHPWTFMLLWTTLTSAVTIHIVDKLSMPVLAAFASVLTLLLWNMVPTSFFSFLWNCITFIPLTLYGWLTGAVSYAWANFMPSLSTVLAIIVVSIVLTIYDKVSRTLKQKRAVSTSRDQPTAKPKKVASKKLSKTVEKPASLKTSIKQQKNRVLTNRKDKEEEERTTTINVLPMPIVKAIEVSSIGENDPDLSAVPVPNSPMMNQYDLIQFDRPRFAFVSATPDGTETRVMTFNTKWFSPADSKDSKTSSPKDQYETLMRNYMNADSDVFTCHVREIFNFASAFLDISEDNLAFSALGNLAEIHLGKVQLVRAAAYKLEEKGRLQEAEHLYRRVLEMRPEEPQSYRDLALVLAKRKQYDECVILFDKIMTRCKPDWDARFSQIEVVSLMDLCGILPFMNQLEVASGFKIPYSIVPVAANPIQVDLRAVLTWDVDGLDLELQVQDPQGEVLNSFSNHSSSGGMLSRDFTGGYGPVEFLARRAFQGLYAFRVKVRSPCSKAILGGEATIRFTTYTNFGNPELQESESRVWRITPSKGLVVDLATVHVGPQRRSRA